MEEQKDKVKSIPTRILSFQGVKRFKSVKRAIRRNLMAKDGTIYPNRPFNNRKPTRGREMNETKKKIYESIKEYSGKHVPHSEQV